MNERAPKAQILFLGTFHFDYPNRDVHKSKHRVDVSTPDRQRQIEEIVTLLSRYRPTKIAVEVSRDRQATLDKEYAAYRSGPKELPTSEVYQLGFRLAKRLDHPRLHAIDTERNTLFVDLARRKLEPREKELTETDKVWRERYREFHDREDAAAFHLSLREQLLRMNAPDLIRKEHGAYSVGFFKFDGDDGYLGADFVSGWYNRNLRIFRNLQRLTASPQERIVLIIGAGHLPILRFVAASSPEYQLVEVDQYLGRPARAAGR